MALLLGELGRRRGKRRGGATLLPPILKATPGGIIGVPGEQAPYPGASRSKNG